MRPPSMIHSHSLPSRRMRACNAGRPHWAVSARQRPRSGQKLCCASPAAASGPLWTSHLTRRINLDLAVEEAVEQALAQCPGSAAPELALVFVSSAYASEYNVLVPELRKRLPSLKLVVGCTVGHGRMLSPFVDSCWSHICHPCFERCNSPRTGLWRHWQHARGPARGRTQPSPQPDACYPARGECAWGTASEVLHTDC